MDNQENVFVNMYTGERLKFDGDISEYDIRKKTAIQKQNEGLLKKYERYHNKFFWGDMTNINDLLQQNRIKLSTLGGILILGCFINHDDTLICKPDKQRTPYTTKEILKDILKISPATFKRFISECKKANIIIVQGRGDNAIYRLNQRFHYVGNASKSESRDKVRIYKKGIMAMYTSGLSLDEIGFLYLILPYINYNNCTIVDNPFSANEKPLTYKELGNILGCSRATLSKYLNMTFEYSFDKSNKVRKYELYIFGKFIGGTKGKYVFCINPLILRRCSELKGTIEYSQLENIFKSVSKNNTD